MPSQCRTTIGTYVLQRGGIHKIQTSEPKTSMAFVKGVFSRPTIFPTDTRQAAIPE